MNFIFESLKMEIDCGKWQLLKQFVKTEIQVCGNMMEIIQNDKIL